MGLFPARFAARYGPLGEERRFQNANGEPVGRWRWVAERLRTLMALRVALGKVREDSFQRAFNSLVQRTDRDHGTVHYVLPSLLVMQFPGQSLRSAATHAIMHFLAEELGQVRIAPAAAPNAEDSAHAVSTEGGRGLLELRWGVPSLRAALF